MHQRRCPHEHHHAQLTSTAAHLYWLPDFGTWVPAKDLKSDIWLQTSAGTWVQISAVDTAHRSAKVYNLSVEGVHTYYVGSGTAAVLVYNCGYKGEAVRAQQRAQELSGQLHFFKESMVTVAVIGVRKKGTKDIVGKVGMSSGHKGDLLNLSDGQSFVPGNLVPGRVTKKGNPAYEHADVCSDICAPLVEQSKMKLDGEVFGGASDKTAFRTFWRLRR
ncbi:polymorphic toxin-type HINT domain-containing protein [Streptomyces werraensis]|uniref:polymorphic toxin-type HINT domain-containing protein n=1 Tax=Streptomyces werraensis TaxID=68284 RepID=UPI00380FAAE2